MNTCLTMSCIHLGFLESFDKDSFLMALRRFIGEERKEIFADCSTNFQGGYEEQKKQHYTTGFLQFRSNFCISRSNSISTQLPPCTLAVSCKREKRKMYPSIHTSSIHPFSYAYPEPGHSGSGLGKLTRY